MPSASRASGVPVFFATNRKHDRKAKSIEFGTESQSHLTLGTASLSILKDDDSTRLAAHSVGPKKSEGAESITDVGRLSILQLDVQDEESVMKAARQQLQSSRAFNNQLLVFVHGYNVDFDNAVRRAGQLAYDLNFDGPTFLFSWPSRQRYFSYLTDRESVDIAVEQLKGFLQRVVIPLNAAKVHLVAHSMGNMVALKALSDLSELEPSRRPIIGEIIDAAPDVAPDVFGQFAAKIQTAGSNLTVYASAADKALALSVALGPAARWLYHRGWSGVGQRCGRDRHNQRRHVPVCHQSRCLCVEPHRRFRHEKHPCWRATAGSTDQSFPASSQRGKYWIYRGLIENSE